MIEYFLKIRRAFTYFAFLILLPLHSTWTPPILVSTAGQPVSPIDGCVLDVNSLNNGVAVWTAPPGLTANIQASFYTSGMGWSAPVIISNTAVPMINLSDPQVSMNNANYCVAVWEGSQFFLPSPVRVVASAERMPDGTWTPVTIISNFITSDHTFFPAHPYCAVNDSGLAVACWTEVRTDDTINTFNYIMASFLPQGGSWTTPISVSGPMPPDPANQGFTPHCAIDALGNVIVAWKNEVPPLVNISAATFNAATSTWSPPVTLDPGGNNDGSATDIPKVAINIADNGNGIVVWNWIDSTGTDNRVYSASFTNGVWGPATIVTETTSATSTLSDANVVMDRFGNATAIWSFTDDNLFNEVFSSSLPFGGAWSMPVIISTNAGNNGINENLVQRPISVNLNGDVMAIYESDTPVNTLYSVTKLFGQPWQLPEFISNTGYPMQNDPHFLNIGIGSCGFALSLWQANSSPIEGGFNQVWSSVHSSPPLPPCNFTGVQCKEKFAAQSICVNTLTWNNCGCVLFFNLFRNGVLIATIPAGGPLTFIDPVCCGRSNTYTLTFVDIFGATSPAATVILP
jgi:hypothetical protein